MEEEGGKKKKKRSGEYLKNKQQPLLYIYI